MTALLDPPAVLPVPAYLDLRDDQAIAQWEALQAKVEEIRPREPKQFDVRAISRRQAG